MSLTLSSIVVIRTGQAQPPRSKRRGRPTCTRTGLRLPLGATSSNSSSAIVSMGCGRLGLANEPEERPPSRLSGATERTRGSRTAAQRQTERRGGGSTPPACSALSSRLLYSLPHFLNLQSVGETSRLKQFVSVDPDREFLALAKVCLHILADKLNRLDINTIPQTVRAAR